MEKWVMPEWMEKYREIINDTGGYTVENLMNDHTTTLYNIIRVIRICCVDSQITLLENLHKDGLI